MASDWEEGRPCLGETDKDESVRITHNSAVRENREKAGPLEGNKPRKVASKSSCLEWSNFGGSGGSSFMCRTRKQDFDCHF